MSRVGQVLLGFVNSNLQFEIWHYEPCFKPIVLGQSRWTAVLSDNWNEGKDKHAQVAMQLVGF